jgi:hypothetical protein
MGFGGEDALVLARNDGSNTGIYYARFVLAMARAQAVRKMNY